MTTEKDIIEELKEKFDKDFVVIQRGRYFGIAFNTKEIKEITFDEAFGCSFFDWDSMICIASENNKQRYDEMRGEDGCGFGKICQICYQGEKEQ